MYACTEFALTITSRRQMAGSPPNLHTMDSRPACIQGVLKVKVKVESHVIRALLCCHENRFFSQANDRIKASLQSNISSISVTFARWKHHCGRSLLSTIALFVIIIIIYLLTSSLTFPALSCCRFYTLTLSPTSECCITQTRSCSRTNGCGGRTRSL